MELDLVNFLIGFIVVVGAAVFFLSNFPKIEAALQNKLEDSLDREVKDKSAEPLHEIFLGFDHDSTSDWVNWLATQDNEYIDSAYERIVNYLASEPEQLGSITGDAVKAIASFRKETDFQVVRDLLRKVREKFQRFKTIDMFYQDAATILIKIKEAEAISFLTGELNYYINQLDTEKIQSYILRALLTSENESLLAPVLISTICNYLVKRSTKLEVIYIIEKRNSDFQKNIYRSSLQTFLQSGVEHLSEDDQLIVEQIFNHGKKFIIENKDSYDEQLWNTVLEICEVPKLRTLFIKLLSNFLENNEEQLVPKQILSLIAKPEPAKSSFRDALAKRYSLTDIELSILKPAFKLEDFYFEKETLILEKSKKTKAMVLELSDDYNSIEKLISLNDVGKADKAAQGAVNLISGGSKFEKLFILRILAANTNKSFIYVDLDKILKANFEVANLKNMANNCKPCIVYIDNLSGILVSDFSKAEELHHKELTKVIQELSLTPSIFFCGNLPYGREAFKQEDPKLYEVINSTIRGSYRFIYSIDIPNEKKKMEVLFKYQSRISEDKLNKSPEYDAQSILKVCANKSMLEYLSFLDAYFMCGLLAYGLLIDVYQFEKEIAPIIVPNLGNLTAKDLNLTEAVTV